MSQMSQSQHSVTCLQPYLAKAEAWRNGAKYSRAAQSSYGSMQIVDKPAEAVVGSLTEFVLWLMPTSTAAVDCSPCRCADHVMVMS